ncbi:MAG: hypothetical protein WC061_01280 [Melioribacteraceae bacterium]
MKLLGKYYKMTEMLSSTFRYAIGAALTAAFLLIIPLLAELITDEMDWSVSDFIAAWILLFTSFFIYKLVSGKVRNFEYRAAVAVAVGTGLFLVWSNLAVGLIGNEDNSANLMYIGVLAVGFLGAIIARLQPKGMTRVLFAMAFAHLLITVIALILRLDLAPESSIIEILGVNGFFAVLWSGSALLFRNAARDEAKL